MVDDESLRTAYPLRGDLWRFSLTHKGVVLFIYTDGTGWLLCSRFRIFGLYRGGREILYAGCTTSIF